MNDENRAARAALTRLFEPGDLVGRQDLLHLDYLRGPVAPDCLVDLALPGHPGHHYQEGLGDLVVHQLGREGLVHPAVPVRPGLHYCHR